MPKPVRDWVKGPSVSAPREELLAWFEAHRGRLMRVPIVMRREAVGFSMRGVMIGALEVYITDAALGIGIASRARRDATGDTCAFIVEGIWRDDQYEIHEAGFHAATPAELAALAHLEVERGG